MSSKDWLCRGGRDEQEWTEDQSINAATLTRLTIVADVFTTAKSMDATNGQPSIAINPQRVMTSSTLKVAALEVREAASMSTAPNIRVVELHLSDSWQMQSEHQTR